MSGRSFSHDALRQVLLRLKERCEKSYAEIASEASVSENTVYNYIGNEHFEFSPRRIEFIRVLEALGATADEQASALNCLEELRSSRRAGPASKEVSRRHIHGLPALHWRRAGRDDAAREIALALDQQLDGEPYVLQGIGGVGKSHLALSYGSECVAKLSLVWWIDAESRTNTVSQLATLFRVVTGRDAPNTGIAAALGSAMNGVGRWLLIFDNVGDVADYSDLLPGGTGRILLTTRNTAWLQSFAGKTLELPSVEDASELLSGRLGSLNLESVVDVRAVVEAVDRLPLALVQAASILTSGAVDTKTFVNLVERRARELLNRGAPADHSSSLTATVEIGIELLAQRNPDGLHLLKILAMLAAESVPSAIWAQRQQDRGLEPSPQWTSDPLRCAAAFASVTQLGFSLAAQGDLKLHRLVRSIVRDVVSDERANLLSEALVLLAGATPGNPWNAPEAWPAYAALLPHIVEVAKARASSNEGARQDVRLLNQAATYLHTRGQYDLALQLFELAHEVGRRVLLPGEYELLDLSGNIALCLHDLGKYERAVLINRELFGEMVERFGEMHPEAMAVGNNLALSLAAYGARDEAIKLNRELLRLRVLTLGADHPDVMRSMSNLAADLCDSSRIDEALSLSRRALALRSQHYGEKHPETCISMHNLASILVCHRHLDEALKMFAKALEYREDLLGDEHPDTVLTRIAFRSVVKQVEDSALE